MSPGFEWTQDQAAAIKLLGGPARHTMLYGGSRCVAGDTVLDGHTMTIRQLAKLGLPVWVETSVGPRLAEPPFLKGRAELLRVDLSDGRSVTVTDDHRFWDGQSWVKAQTLVPGSVLAVRSSSLCRRQTSSERGLSGYVEDARRSMRKAGDYLARCLSGFRRYGRRLLQAVARGLKDRALPSYALAHSRSDLFLGDRVEQSRGSSIHRGHRRELGLEHIRSGRAWFPRATTDGSLAFAQSSGSQDRDCGQIYEWSQRLRRACRQSLRLSCRLLSSARPVHSARVLFAQFFGLSYDIPLASGYDLEKVLRVTRVAEQDYFTLHVPVVEQYFANGILHHNSGKTFVLCGAVATRALKAPGSRHAIFRHRFNHLKTSIGFDTFPKMMSLRFPGVKYKIDRTDWVIKIGDGSEIWLGGLDDKERTEKILGQEYATIYFNECSQIAYSAVLMARTRLAQKTVLINRGYYDCNPPGSKHWTAMLFVNKKDPASRPAGQPIPNPDNFAATVMNPFGNRHNLSEEYIAELEALPERQRNRFLLGKFTAELDNALWTVDSFPNKIPGDMAAAIRWAEEYCERIIVSVDPSGASGEEDKRSDEIGIIVAGRTHDKKYVVLCDGTLRAGPATWARRAIGLYKDFKADAIVAERNFGGAMVAHTIRAENSSIPVREVVAARSKSIRAEPISALYSKGVVRHATGMGELEDQMCVEKGTLIETARGQIPVEEVLSSDWVMTRDGLAPLKWAGKTGNASELVEISTKSSSIRVTACHPIYLSKSRKFANALSVKPSDSLLVSRNWASMGPRSLGVGDGFIGCLGGIIDMPAAISCIARYTKNTLATFLKASTFITSMEIRAIIGSTISGLALGRSTLPSIFDKDSIPHSPKRNPAHASFAGQKRGPIGEESQIDFAQTHARSALVESVRKIQVDNVPVYNLSVADGYLPEFYANGILTHNCNMTTAGYMGERSPDRLDALVWALSDLSQGTQVQILGVM